MLEYFHSRKKWNFVGHFLVQVATGFAMTFYYRPTVMEAFASVQYIMTEANFGCDTQLNS